MGGWVMSVSIIQTSLGRTEYAGLSTDVKPTNCSVMSTFFEMDTINEFLFDGEKWIAIKVKPFIFHNAVVSTGQGNILTVGAFRTLRISIYGTATARTVQFYEKITNGNLVPLMGYNISTSDLASSTSKVISETWIFDITGLRQVVMNVSAVSGGNLSVTGTVVS